MAIVVRGLSEYQNRLKQVNKKALRGFRKEARAAADPSLRIVREALPYRSGHLRSEHKIRMSVKRIVISVPRKKVPYAGKIWFGPYGKDIDNYIRTSRRAKERFEKEFLALLKRRGLIE